MMHQAAGFCLLEINRPGWEMKPTALGNQINALSSSTRRNPSGMRMSCAINPLARLVSPFLRRILLQSAV
jgi:hypothetical protein